MPFPTDTEPDTEVDALLARELERQTTGLQLIASENFTSPAVMRAVGSVLTNKYSEGYPGKRYYGGNAVIDGVESLAIERAKTLFGADHANVQPHSGANANMCAYQALIDPAPFRAIADEIGAYFLFDAAHIAGLIAGGQHPNPVPYADVVTFTTHKTLRGPRGGCILSKEAHAKAIDKAVFPGLQGGPL